MIEMRRQRIDYRSGKAAIIRRASMSYDRLMQVVAEQAMQRAMDQQKDVAGRPSSQRARMRDRFGEIKLMR